MHDHNVAKVILLSCGEYPDKDRFSDVVTALSASRLADQGFVRLQETRIDYSETEKVADPDRIHAIESIETARNFDIYHLANLSGDHSDAVDDGFGGIRSDLVFDETGCFMLITEVTIRINPRDDLSTVAHGVFQNRAMFNNLDITEAMDNVFSRASSAVANTIRGLNKKAGFRPEDIRFCEESTLPLFVGALENVDGISEVFRNEEINPSFLESDGLTQQYPGSLFYPGWNYTIATRFPPEVMTNIIRLVARAQMFYFSLRHFKEYFESEFSETIRDMEKLRKVDIDEAERLRLIYYDMTARMDRYVNGLFPKYRLEVTRLLERWNCSEDRHNVEKYIALNSQIKEGIHKKKMERGNDKQNRALAIIALIQLVSLYEAVETAFTLKNSESFIFLLGTAAIAVCVVSYVMVLLSRD